MRYRSVCPFLAVLILSEAGLAAAGALVPLAPLSAGTVSEWRIEGVPAVTNVFDPDVLAVDVTVNDPEGRARRIPAFWYRSYRHELRNGSEVLSPNDEGEWRFRYLLQTSGPYSVRVEFATLRGAPAELARTNFIAGPSPIPVRGPVRIAPEGQFFETDNGQALPLVGADVCWPGARGTYDYEDWLPAMAASGWNWIRLWMAPWAFGIETAPAERLNYRMDRAWQLDRVLDMARAHRIYVLLCLDYHGMFEEEPDYWGGNNYWPRHPYNKSQGGPCANQREFFNLPDAQRLYQKRLRYLTGRYGADPNLFAWEFFNEIDNVYRYLVPEDVAAWHGLMGAWLKEHDPWRHLITTSLTGGSDRPEIWSLPEMDLATYHTYAEPAPARRLTEVAASMHRRYDKPILIAEAGVDWRGWARESDPYLRGFRQLLWGGVMAGTAGTSMSWWWESIHADNVYPCYRALTHVLADTHWGSGPWSPLEFQPNAPMPTRVADVIPGAPSFDVTLALDGSWGAHPVGKLAVADPRSADAAAQRLNAFVHGTAHAELRASFQLDGWFSDRARLILHLNSVSGGAVMTVRVDGGEIYRKSVPNKDGSYDVNDEYNQDYSVDLPSGHHLVEIRNAGSDWFYLDWVRLEAVLPSTYEGDWTPAVSATGIRHEGEFLLYAVAPGMEYPAQARVESPAIVTRATLTVSNLPAGDYGVLWFRTTDGLEVDRGKVRVGTDGLLHLALPPITEDLVGHIFTPPHLRAEGFDAGGDFVVVAEGGRPDAFRLESAEVGGTWADTGLKAIREPEEARWLDAAAAGRRYRLYRLRFDAN